MTVGTAINNGFLFKKSGGILPLGERPVNTFGRTINGYTINGLRGGKVYQVTVTVGVDTDPPSRR